MSTFPEWLIGSLWCCGCGKKCIRENYYMVHDRVWFEEAGLPDCMLCIACLEGRLGRTLVPADFTRAPVNRGRYEPRL